MKDKNNISNSDKQVYKLKPEYMDDLVMKLDEHRPNNRKWIYIASSLVLLLFVSGAIFWYPNKNQIDNEESLKNRESSLMSELNTPSKIINDDKKETVVITNSNNELKTLTEERDKSVKNSSQSRKEETGTIKKTVKQKSRKSINKISANQVFANDIKTNETSELDSVIEEKLILKYEVKKEQKQTLDSIRNREGDGAEEVSFELIVSDQKTDSSKGDSIDSNQTVFNNNSENKEEFKKETNIILDSNLNNKQSDSVSNKQDESIINDTLIEEDTTEAISMLDSTSIKLNESPKLKNNWQLSLLAGSNISFSRFSNSTNQEYATLRKEEENYLVSLSGGLNFEKFISENVKLTTGVNYISYGSNNNYSPVTNYNDSRQFNGYDSVYSLIIDSIYYHPTSTWLPYSNGTDTTIDSSFVNSKLAYDDSTAYLSSGKVSFSYIEIPLMIGYYKTLKNWSFGINTGVGLGLLTRSSGYYIGEDLKSTEVAKSQKIMWDFILGPEINYEFSDNYYIGFQSNIRLGLNNISLSEPIDRKYYNIQFNAKIGYKF